MPAKRVAKKAKGAAVAKKPKKSLDEDAGDDDFFLGSDDEGKRQALEESEDEQQVETAEEKRLRIAREYLANLHHDLDTDDRRGVTGGSDEEGGEGDSDDERGGTDRVAERLKQDAAEASGRHQRKIASRLHLPTEDTDYSAPSTSRGHRLSATALALTHDDTIAFTVSKDGTICKWDIETQKRTSLYRPGDRVGAQDNQGTADWVKKAAKVGAKAALYGAAVSSDGKYLAVGGGDKKIHVFDAKSGVYIQAFPGHRDVVTGLAFREGTHTLYSGSFDRTVKLWSLDDRAYMDSLFGHQAEVLAVDALRAERVISSGHDHTCRVWKIPEETQLIFRAHDRVIDCVRYLSGTEWVSGGSDGTVHLWSQMKKKPVWSVRKAHGPGAAELFAAAPGDTVPGNLGAEHASVCSVAVCKGSDLVASGAGDGAIRLWAVQPGKSGGAGMLACKGALPQRGFVNGLAIARSAQFVAAAVGQEPRMGRWGRDGRARNGLAVHRISIRDE